MNFNVGDVVDFSDPVVKTTHRGVILQVSPGRDKRSASLNKPLRDYLVMFDSPWYGHHKAWIAAEDMSVVRKASTYLTVNYSPNRTDTINKELNDKMNIKISSDNLIKNTKSSQEVDNSIRPWEAFYMTSDEFFDILKAAFDDTYGATDGSRWHPEDLYINISSVLEVVSNTLCNSMNIKSGKELRGVKNS